VPIDRLFIARRKFAESVGLIRKLDAAVWSISLVVVILMWMPTFWCSFVGRFVDQWAYGELLINWSGGFVRRGLYGTLAIGFHKLTGHGVITATSVIFVILTLTQIAVLFRLLWQYRNNYALLLLTSLSPVMLLFATYDNAGYWRKDSFLNVAVLLHSLVARECLSGAIRLATYRKIFVYLIIPGLIINTLIDEGQGLFLPIHVALTFSVLRHSTLNQSEENTRKAVTTYIVGYLCTLVVASIFAHGDAHTSAVMFESVQPWSGMPRAQRAFFGDAMQFHGESLAYYVHLVNLVTTFHPIFLLTYLLAFLIGPVMLGFLIQCQINGTYNGERNSVLWSFVPPMLLFFVGWDYGRWINMLAVSVVAYLLHIPCRSELVSRGTNLKFPSVYSWVPPFLLTCWVALYTLGWSVPVAGDPIYVDPNPFKSIFLTVWLQVIGDLLRVLPI
jgi:hypothetical protein